MPSWRIFAATANSFIEPDFCLQAVEVLTEHSLRRRRLSRPGRCGTAVRQTCSERIHLALIIPLRLHQTVHLWLEILR